MMYVASWFYKVDITIYSKEYAGTGGSLMFKADGLKGNSERPCPMWHILYHDNKHYNSVQSKESISANVRKENDRDRYEADLQHALNEHGQDYIKLANKAQVMGVM